MTTPNELYQMRPQEVTNSAWEAETFVEAIGFYCDGNQEYDKRIEVKTIVHHDYDCRRFFSLETYWFEGVPVGFLQRAGREGDDHKVAVVTNNKQFLKLRNLLEELGGEMTEWDPTKEYPNLLEFYQDNAMNYR